MVDTFPPPPPRPRPRPPAPSAPSVPPVLPRPVDPRHLEAAARKIAFDEKKAAEAIERSKYNFIHAVEVAAAKNADIPKHVFASIADEYAALHPGRASALLDARARAPTNSLQRGRYNREIEHANWMELRARVEKLHPQEGVHALQAVGKELQPKSLFLPAIKTLYDSENEGPQWGGIVGALAGGGIAALVAHYTGGFSWLSAIGMAIAVAAGAYAGHKFLDSKPIPLITPDLHSKHRPRIAAAAKEKETPVVNFDKLLKDGERITGDADVRTMGIKGNPAPVKGLTV